MEVIDRMSPVMLESRSLLLGTHIVGVILGFGGALIADLLFFKFIKDGKISTEEFSTLKTLFKVIWLGIAIILISGSLTFLGDPSFYITSAKFISKMSVVVVIIVNGLFINKLVFPIIKNSAYNDFLASADLNARKKISLAFALGSISTVSWWTAFTLGWLTFPPGTYFQIMAVYSIMLLVGVVISQLIMMTLTKRKLVQNLQSMPIPPTNP